MDLNGPFSTSSVKATWWIYNEHMNMRVTWWNNKQINWIDEHGFLHPPWIYKFPWCLDISHDVWYVWIPMGKSYFTKPDMFGFGIPSDSHDSFQVRSQSRHHLDDGNDLPSTAISAISHYLTNILPFNPTNITLCNYIVGQKNTWCLDSLRVSDDHIQHLPTAPHLREGRIFKASHGR